MAQPERLVGVQVLRGVAAVLVTLHHFCLTTVTYGTAGDLPVVGFMAEWGQCGVDMFFCISGFVMLVAADRGAFDPIDFLARRAIRIYPMYWIATALFIGMVLVLNTVKLGAHAALGLPLFDAGYIAQSFLLWPTKNPVDGSVMPILAQGWTLSYELYFYLFVSVFVWVFRSLPLAVLGIAVAMIWLYLFSGDLIASEAGRDFLSNPIYLEFILGACVFLVTRRYRPAGIAVLITGVGLLLMGANFGDGRVFSLGIPSAMILYGIVAIEGRFRYLAALARVGNASYSLYLMHGFLTYAYGSALKRGFFAGAPSQGVAIIAGTAIAIVASIVFWRLVESRITDGLADRYRQAVSGSRMRERPAA